MYIIWPSLKIFDAVYYVLEHPSLGTHFPPKALCFTVKRYRVAVIIYVLKTAETDLCNTIKVLLAYAN